MKMNKSELKRGPHFSLCSKWRLWPILVVFLGPCAGILIAQNTHHDSLSQQIQKLTDAIAITQSQLELSQRQISEMQKQLKALQQQVAQSGSGETIPASPGSASSGTATQSQTADTPAQIQDIREQQAMIESQIATQEQTKIESESKYPVKITGLLLLNSFINTRAVDMEATPTLAVPGSGSTGASVRQTVLGFDARGPHLFGASSYADLRVDFDGAPQSNVNAGSYSGPYSSNAAMLRLRTAHAGLEWEHTVSYFSLDRPLFNPDTPTSLTAVAEPALAWSGNLWTWNPQAGLRQEIPLPSSRDLQLEAALIDVSDAPLSPTSIYSGATPAISPSSAEKSRWPGAEARVSLLGPGSREENGDHFGLGGYFAPHRVQTNQRFDSWVATADTRIVLPVRLELTGSVYRGLGLGGLGGGAYKDFGYITEPNGGGNYLNPLDDAGGWAQLKEKISSRVELNGAFGMDDAFASELRKISAPGGTIYQNLSRNQTFTGNVIYKPSLYLLFSLEYRHLESYPVFNSSTGSNVIGLGAGFKF
ncbi:MAG: hypothetical protein ABSE46_23685 [Terracidiphilus sp.]|jgi:uncharacterized coiled-coil protein SlyX